MAHENLNRKAGLRIGSDCRVIARDFGQRHRCGASDCVWATSKSGKGFAVRWEGIPLIDVHAGERTELTASDDTSAEASGRDDGGIREQTIQVSAVKDKGVRAWGLGGVENTLSGYQFSVAEGGTRVGRRSVVSSRDQGADFSEALFSDGVCGGRHEAVNQHRHTVRLDVEGGELGNNLEVFQGDGGGGDRCVVLGCVAGCTEFGSSRDADEGNLDSDTRLAFEGREDGAERAEDGQLAFDAFEDSFSENGWSCSDGISHDYL